MKSALNVAGWMSPLKHNLAYWAIWPFQHFVIYSNLVQIQALFLYNPFVDYAQSIIEVRKFLHLSEKTMHKNFPKIFREL